MKNEFFLEGTEINFENHQELNIMQLTLILYSLE
jgi:hypothetical protein